MIRIVGSVLLVAGLIILAVFVGVSSFHTVVTVDVRYAQLAPMRVIKYGGGEIGVIDAGVIDFRKIEGLKYNVSIMLNIFPSPVLVNGTYVPAVFSIGNATVYEIRKGDYPIVRGFIASMGNTTEDVRKMFEVLEAKSVSEATLENLTTPYWSYRSQLTYEGEIVGIEPPSNLILVVFVPEKKKARILPQPGAPTTPPYVLATNLSLTNLEGDVRIVLKAKIEATSGQLVRALDITLLGVLLLALDIYRAGEYRALVKRFRHE